jgi:predicted 2-oxoglutarate/Fe(II)-dependent dioxygenase YbiX/peroxiredoxin
LSDQAFDLKRVDTSPTAPGSADSDLGVGDRSPFFYGMGPDQAFRSAEDQFGRPSVLVFSGKASPEATMPIIAALSARAQAFAALNADVLLLVSATNLAWLQARRPTPTPDMIYCPTSEAFEQVGVDRHGPVTLVVDRSQRIVARLEAASPETSAEAALAALAALPCDAPAIVSCPAPVLMVPHLFDGALCTRLIETFETGRQTQGAMASVDLEGRPVNRVDDGKKRRRDVELDPAGAMLGHLLELLDRRLLPDIRRAFHVEIAHVDRVLIACYDETGGYFRRHRDNAAPQVAYRQFALSVNLNSGAYEGGELMFPEHGPHRYNPPTGAGMVFSGSLLHEALPIRRGRRYVLLTFLHDDAAEARRRAYLASGGRAG